MPAKSKSQAIAARMALAAKQGKIPVSKLKGASKAMYKMSVDKLEHLIKFESHIRELVRHRLMELYNN